MTATAGYEVRMTTAVCTGPVTVTVSAVCASSVLTVTREMLRSPSLTEEFLRWGLRACKRDRTTEARVLVGWIRDELRRREQGIVNQGGA